MRRWYTLTATLSRAIVSFSSTPVHLPPLATRMTVGQVFPAAYNRTYGRFRAGFTHISEQ